MRKLKLQVQTSVDGFVAGPSGEMDWMTWDWDEELKHFVWSLTEPIDLILLGRKMAEGFIDAWTQRANDPETAERFARKMVDTRKIVFSRAGANFERENTEIRGGDLAVEIDKIKKEDGADIIVYGGAEFVSALVRENLIDDYYLFVNPTAVGKGLTIFGEVEKNFSLEPAGSRTFDCGVVVLHYQAK